MRVLPNDIDRVRAQVEAELETSLVEFRENPLQGGTSRTYLGRTAAGTEVFVKVGDKAFLDRARAVAECCRGLDFVPAVLDRGHLELDGCRVQISECKRGEIVFEPALLSPSQFRSWVRGYMAFSSRVQVLREQATGIRSRLGYAHTYREAILAHVSRSWLARWILSGLLKVAARASAIDDRLTAVIHGDFGFPNLAFSRNGLAAIYDFDFLTLGMPCEDLLFSFSYRFRDDSPRRGVRKKLLRMLAEMVSMTNWPEEDWRAAIDLQRLQEAAGLIEECSNPVRFALKAARRDRRHALMLKVLRNSL